MIIIESKRKKPATVWKKHPNALIEMLPVQQKMGWSSS